MNELKKIFDYQGKQVRTVVVDGEPMFVAKDVCEILELDDVRRAVERLDDDERSLTPVIDSLGREQEAWAVNEAGLYGLVLGSKKPEAKSFKRWVKHEVLPSIRKHGGYLTAEKIEEALLNPDTIIRLATNLKAEQQKVRLLEEKRKEDAPKVLFADSVAASHTNILIGELAKILKQNGLDIGQNRLFEWLRQRGYLINRRGTDYNMPTQKAMEMELFIIKETTINKPDGSIHISKTVKVTGKGQVYFVNKLIVKTA